MGGPHFPPRREVSRAHKAPRTIIDVTVTPTKIRTAVFRSAYQRPGNLMKLAEPVISQVLAFQNHPGLLCGIPNTRGRPHYARIHFRWLRISDGIVTKTGGAGQTAT